MRRTGRPTGRPKGSGVTPLFVRFITKIEVAPNGCWLWTGALNSGYGVVWDGAKVQRAHRVSYELFRGPLPVGTHGDHLCRTPRCVNPWHLDPVSKKENTLRGNSLAAQHARQTHCIHGHEFTPENTRIYSCAGQPFMRICRQCNAIRQRTYHQKRRATA